VPSRFELPLSVAQFLQELFAPLRLLFGGAAPNPLAVADVCETLLVREVSLAAGTAWHSYDGDRIRLAERNATVYETAIGTKTDFATLTTAKLGNFLESVAGTAEPAVPGTDGLQVTALTEAAYLADDRGRQVDVQALTMPLAEAARGSLAPCLVWVGCVHPV
jgi:hypothetical protein